MEGVFYINFRGMSGIIHANIEWDPLHIKYKGNKRIRNT